MSKLKAPKSSNGASVCCWWLWLCLCWWRETDDGTGGAADAGAAGAEPCLSELAREEWWLGDMSKPASQRSLCGLPTAPAPSGAEEEEEGGEEVFGAIFVEMLAFKVRERGNLSRPIEGSSVRPRGLRLLLLLLLLSSRAER